MLTIQNLLHCNESYTHKNWVFRDITVGFSRLYYVIDGEAYYEEKGEKVRLQHGHLYLTPVKTPFSLSDNPNDQLLHTYAHVTTLPAVSRLIDIEVREGTPLFDAVTLWRKYARSEDHQLLLSILRFLLSCIDHTADTHNKIASKIQRYVDEMEGYTFDMTTVSRALGYSREYLTRSFFAARHQTPKQYFQQKRMNIALEKLLGGARVKVVAEELEFSSAYAFSKAFKNQFGLYPIAYVRALCAEQIPKSHTNEEKEKD